MRCGHVPPLWLRNWTRPAPLSEAPHESRGPVPAWTPVAFTIASGILPRHERSPEARHVRSTHPAARTRDAHGSPLPTPGEPNSVRASELPRWSAGQEAPPGRGAARRRQGHHVVAAQAEDNAHGSRVRMDANLVSAPDREGLFCVCCKGLTLHRWWPEPDAGAFWRCGECGEPNVTEPAPEGHRLNPPPACPNCGSQAKEMKDKFCGDCGTSLWPVQRCSVFGCVAARTGSGTTCSMHRPRPPPVERALPGVSQCSVPPPRRQFFEALDEASGSRGPIPWWVFASLVAAVVLAAWVLAGV